MLICPYCKNEFKALSKHVFYKHGKTTTELKKEFPNICLREVTIENTEKCICQYCNKEVSSLRYLKIHINRVHPEHAIKTGYQCKEKPHFKCAICGKETNILYGHIVEKHQMNWEIYCSQYNHDVNQKVYISEQHKKQLSINKTKFYASERGLNERKRLSKKYAGENNPATKPEVRKKISDAAVKRMIKNQENNNFWDYSYGIRFKFHYNNKEYYTRSYEEFKVLYTLLINNISFNYETKIINYILNNQPKKYIVDLLINDMYIEIKSDKNTEKFYKIQKYKIISNMLDQVGKKLYILNFKTLCELLKIKNIPNEFQIIQFIQQLLSEDKCTISYVCQTGKNSRVLAKIDKNYKENKNIKFRSLQK